MSVLPDNSVALVVTSPPYFVGKDYELAIAGDADNTSRIPTNYLDYLVMLRDVFSECVRVLEPGGRIAVNVANLGRKPYRSLSADVIAILQDELGLLLRGEVIWQKAKASGGSCAWGSFAKASNPVLRDNTERLVIASKGSFARARKPRDRAKAGLPNASSLATDEFLDVTRDLWEIDAESATRIGHPAPFPIELPRRVIDLYTYKGDIVVDPFLGSGTTLVAAARTGRIGVGFDTDPGYVALAEQRLAAELERVDRIESSAGTELDALSYDERQESFHLAATAEGRKIDDIAYRVLTEAGFEISTKARLKAAGLNFTYLVTGADSTSTWFVDVVGAFTSSRPGLQRIDTLWRLLGRLHVLRTLAPEARALVLTSNLPRPGTEGDKALRAVGTGGVFDALELYDPATAPRLAHYATAAPAVALPGFWTDADISR
jgi:DNA modification methylase